MPNRSLDHHDPAVDDARGEIDVDAIHQALDSDVFTGQCAFVADRHDLVAVNVYECIAKKPQLAIHMIAVGSPIAWGVRRAPVA